MPRIRQSLVLFVVAICTAAHAATPVSRDEAGAVATRWLEVAAFRDAGGDGGAGVVVHDVAAFEREGETLAWIVRLAPEGWVMVPARSELAPVKAWSPRGAFDPDATGGLAALARDDLIDRTAALSRAAPAAPAEHPAWLEMRTKSTATTTGMAPLLTSTWQQGSPYNDDCPQGDGAQTFVGCTPLAVTQIMRYHRWPPRGVGLVARWWAGDVGCGGSTPATRCGPTCPTPTTGTTCPTPPRPAIRRR